MPALIDRRNIAHFDWGLLVSIILIPCVGLTVLYSAGFDPDSAGVYLSWLGITIHSAAFVRQLAYIGVGLLVMCAALSFPSSIFNRFAYPIYAVCIGLLVLVLLHGSVSNGARRWIDLGFINLQPAEPMKLGLILALSRFLARFPAPSGGYRLKHLFFPFMFIALPMALIAKQPDLGSALALAAIGGAMIVFVGVNWRTLLILVLTAALIIPSGWHFLHDYQKRRLLVLLDPESDPLGSGYHIIQSKIAVGSGGFGGRGFLEGTQSQLEFLPEHTTDFVFSVLSEEWGFVGGAIVLLLYCLLIYRMLRVVARTRDAGDTLLVFGVVSMLFFHTVINIGMVVGVFPVVGIPLPLFSYGGSSVLSTMCALGLVLGVSMRRFMFVAKG
jgi:rod shape determining protein RodA